LVRVVPVVLHKRRLIRMEIQVRLVDRLLSDYFCACLVLHKGLAEARRQGQGEH
jgi:hypothetical protein